MARLYLEDIDLQMVYIQVIFELMPNSYISAILLHVHDRVGHNNKLMCFVPYLISIYQMPLRYI